MKAMDQLAPDPEPPEPAEYTGVQKLFLLWREIGDKIDHYISYFFCVKQHKVSATNEITG